MKVSIITINYNNSVGLQNTIESVKNQTCRNDFEYIIIDGASTDNSVDIIKENQNIVRYWVSEQDNGIYDAINKGINVSTGEYLMFLNSGDILTCNSSISYFLEQAKDDTLTDIFYGDIECTLNSKSNSWIHKHPDKLTLQFLEYNNINHQSSFIKSNLFEELGRYNLKYPLASDHWFYLKAFISDKIFTHIDFPIVLFNYDGVGSNNRDKYEQEMITMWNELIPRYVREIVKELNSKKKKYSFLEKFKFRLQMIKQLYRG